VLAGSTVTNTNTPTIVMGDLGVSPGSAVTGFPPGTVIGGTIHAADAAAAQAQSDLTNLYNTLASTACNTDLTGQDLGGKTLTPGVYCFSTSAQLTGTLTLDAQGNPNAIFLFKIGSSLTTASGSSVLLINSASSCGVFWQVGSSATLGTGTSLAGNIVALTSITLNTGAGVTGRTLARNGAVTLDNSHVTLCTGGPGFPPSIGAIPTLSESVLILLAGLLALSGLVALRRRKTPLRVRIKR
jgi:type VI secretion system secreted protein VgrG